MPNFEELVEVTTKDGERMWPRPTLDQLMEAIPSLCANPTRCPWCGLPLADSKCNACFPPSQPSREFLIRQAVLNWLALKTPNTLQCYGAAGCLGVYGAMWKDVPEDYWFLEGVRAEFAKLVGAA